jgi:hypothetical protein
VAGFFLTGLNMKINMLVVRAEIQMINGRNKNIRAATGHRLGSTMWVTLTK